MKPVLLPTLVSQASYNFMVGHIGVFVSLLNVIHHKGPFKCPMFVRLSETTLGSYVYSNFV